MRTSLVRIRLASPLGLAPCGRLVGLLLGATLAAGCTGAPGSAAPPAGSSGRAGDPSIGDPGTHIATGPGVDPGSVIGPPEAPADLVSVSVWDATESLDRPRAVSAEEASRRLEPGARVIGLEVGGPARAYEMALLGRHPVVNDELAGVPLVLAWSPWARCAAAYVRPVVDGLRLEFGDSGKLMRNASLPYDRESTTLWNPLRGEAVWGALAGRPLEPLPVTATTWSGWVSSRPDTTAVVGEEGSPDPYADYLAGPQIGHDAPVSVDGRLPAKEVVIGIALGDMAAAWALEDLARHPVSNAVLADRRALLVYDAERAAALAYDPVVDERALVFEIVPDEAGPILRDTRTGSRWNGRSGEAVAGRLAGRRLARLPALTALWFAWRDHHPNTLLLDAGQ